MDVLGAGVEVGAKSGSFGCRGLRYFLCPLPIGLLIFLGPAPANGPSAPTGRLRLLLDIMTIRAFPILATAMVAIVIVAISIVINERVKSHAGLRVNAAPTKFVSDTCCLALFAFEGFHLGILLV